MSVGVAVGLMKRAISDAGVRRGGGNGRTGTSKPSLINREDVWAVNWPRLSIESTAGRRGAQWACAHRPRDAGGR